MHTRAELEAELERARDKLANLPPAHHYPHQGQAEARRAALQARIAWLENEVSTAPVHRGLPAVENVPKIGDALAAADHESTRDSADSATDSEQ